MGYIQAEIDTSKLRGLTARNITVHSNDPRYPRVTLLMRVDALSSVELFPDSVLRIANARPDLAVTRLLVRRDSAETGELRLSNLEASVPWLAVDGRRLTETRPAGDGLPTGYAGDWLVEARLAGLPADYGLQDATIRFATGLGREPEVTVPVRAQLQPPVRVSVPRVDLAPAAPGEPVSETLLLTVRRGLDPTAMVVDSESPEVEVELEPAGRRHFKLHLRWQGDEPVDSAITFRVGRERFRLPVTATP